MSLAALQESAFTAAAPAAWLSDAAHEPALYMTVGQMLDFCNQRPMAQAFTARGVVIDTSREIGDQLRAFFPAHIDVTPIIERIAYVCAERAKATAQPLQVVSFDHLKQVKPIESDGDANMDSFIEVFSDRRMKISSYTGIKTALKAGAGGSGGSDPHQMLAELRQADIQGFALQVKSLDISDAKASELLANMGLAQAFGGDAPAIAAALETLAKGGPEAVTLKAAIEQISEIKNLRAALTNAQPAEARPIAAAIAIKTEALSAQLQTLNLPTPVRANIVQTVEGIKTVLTGRQIEFVIEKLSASPAMAMARVANDFGRTQKLAPIARAMAAVQFIAQNNAMPVRDVITLAITGKATPSMAEAVRTLTQVIAKPDFLPTIEKIFPAATALPVRAALITPVLQAAAQTPIAPAAVTVSVQKLAETTALPTLKMAAVMLEQSAQPVNVQPVAQVLRAPQIEMVAENLSALAMTHAVPAAAKTELAVVKAQVEALSVQARAPEPAPLAVTPQPLPAQSPLDTMTRAMDVKAPERIEPSAIKIERTEAKAENPAVQMRADNDRQQTKGFQAQPDAKQPSPALKEDAKKDKTRSFDKCRDACDGTCCDKFKGVADPAKAERAAAKEIALHQGIDAGFMSRFNVALETKAPKPKVS